MKPFRVRIVLILASILLIFVLFIGGLVVYVRGFSESQTYFYCMNILDYTLRTEEAITSSVKDTYNQIYSDDLITRLMLFPDHTPQDLLNGLKRIESYRRTNFFIDSIYVYNAQNDTFYIASMYGTSAIQESGDFFDAQAAGMVRDLSAYSYMQPIARQLSVTYPRMQTLNYISFLRYNTLARPEYVSAVIINLRQELFLPHIDSTLYGEQATVDIVDTEGRSWLPDTEGIMQADLTADPDIREVLAQSEDRGYFPSPRQDSKTIVFWQGLFSGYCRLVLRADINQLISANDIRIPKTMLGAFTVGLCALLAVCAFLLRWLFVWSSAQVQRIKAVQAERERESRRNRRFLLAQFFRDCNQDSAESWCELLLESGVDIARLHHFRILAFIIDGYDEIVARHAHAEARDALKYTLSSSIETLLPGCLFTSFENEGRILALTAGNEKSDALEQPCADIQQECAGKHGGLSLTVLVSSVFHMPYQTSAVFSSLMESIPYRQLFPSGGVIHQSEVAGRETGRYTYPGTEVRHIIATVMNGDFAAAKEGTGFFLTTISALSYSAFRRFLLGFIINLDEHIRCFLANNAIEDLESVSVKLFYLSNMEHLGQIEEGFNDVFDQIERRINNKRDTRSDTLITSIQNIVESSFSDPLLSLNTVSEAIGLSAAYVGRLFKKNTGLSFVDFVLNTRIAAAQNALEHTDKSVKEIAELVGFTTESYFYKMFKNALGVTPSKYRANKRYPQA